MIDGAVGAVRRAMAKVFPSHWSFLLGELAMFSFAVLVLSGLYLAVFYDASSEVVAYDGSYAPMHGVDVSRAYASVLDITFDRPAGAIVRQTHHWASLVFVGAIVAHAMRVFFTGAYRRPRRLNWTIGITLLGLAMVTGFFGLALPHDVLGGTGARIGHAFAVSIPVIGPGVADVVFAGGFASDGMLHRFWLLHVVVLPALIAALLGGHLALVWLQTHTVHRNRKDDEQPGEDPGERVVTGAAAWPGYALKTAGLFAIVVAVTVGLGGTVQIAPVWLYGPFDPAAATVPAQPDWYLGWVEGILRIGPAADVEVWGREIPSPFLTGGLVSLVVFVVLYAWPFAEEALTGDRRPHHVLDRPRERPVRTALGVAGLAWLGVLLMAGSHDLQGLMLRVPVDTVTTAYRWAALVVPPVAGILTFVTCRALVRSEKEGRGPPRRGPRHPDDVPRVGAEQAGGSR